MRLTFASLLLGLGLAAPLAAQQLPNAETQGTSALVGKIVSSAGKPVRGARVLVFHIATARTFTSEPTSGNGQYKITELPYGFVDLAVESSEGRFVSDQVVNLPPAGKAAVIFSLTPAPGGPWSQQFAGTKAETVGTARLRARPKGRDFWKSPRGVAILAGTGGAALLAIAGSGGDSELDATPFVP